MVLDRQQRGHGGVVCNRVEYNFGVFHILVCPQGATEHLRKLYEAAQNTSVTRSTKLVCRVAARQFILTTCAGEIANHDGFEIDRVDEGHRRLREIPDRLEGVTSECASVSAA